jgi:glutaredoxin
MSQVNVFYAPSCGYSAATAAFLLTRGVSYNLINVDKAPELRRDLARRLKVQKITTPVVEAGDDLHMAPPLGRLKELSDQWLSADQAGERERERERDADADTNTATRTPTPPPEASGEDF